MTEIINQSKESQIVSQAEFELRRAMLEGKTITVIRSDDSEDSGWTIIKKQENGKFLIQKEGVGSKIISPDKFVEIDNDVEKSEFLTKGSKVKVLRNNRKLFRNDTFFEEDWHIERFERNRDNTGMDVVVVKDDESVEKTIPYEVLKEWNETL